MVSCRADGLGNIRDERLFQTWKKDKKVKWLRPEQSAEEWFNMFVLHQNRIGAFLHPRASTVTAG